MKRLLTAAAISLALAAPASADEAFDERLKIATEYVEASMQDIDMVKLISQMWAPVVQQIETSGKTLDEDQLQAIDTLYQETFSEPMFDIMRAQDEIMAEVLSLEEITAIRDFYQTPAGAGVMKKLPEILALQQPQIMAMVEGAMPAIMPQLIEIVEGQ
jgi:hypothetical protein